MFYELMRGEFLDLSGARLYYYAAGTRGAGVPVVFLHGFATSGHLWADVVPLMPAGHRLVVLDLLGYGRSTILKRPRVASKWTCDHTQERVIELMDEAANSSAPASLATASAAASRSRSPCVSLTACHTCASSTAWRSIDGRHGGREWPARRWS